MPRISAESLSLDVDGRKIDLKKPSRGNFELNKALLKPQGFKDFVNDPKAFAAKYELQIDDHIAGQLKQKLAGITSYDELQRVLATVGGGDAGATVWAIASSAYSVSTSKVAVAF
jgi:hypothetical protein